MNRENSRHLRQKAKGGDTLAKKLTQCVVGLLQMMVVADGGRVVAVDAQMITNEGSMLASACSSCEEEPSPATVT